VNHSCVEDALLEMGNGSLYSVTRDVFRVLDSLWLKASVTLGRGITLDEGLHDQV